MNDLTLLNELEQKIVGLVSALKSEREKNSDSNNKVMESQKLSKIEQDTDRDFYMGAEEAVKYGLIDEVIENGAKNLFVLPINKLFSYIIIGILKSIPAKHIGKDA